MVLALIEFDATFRLLARPWLRTSFAASTNLSGLAELTFNRLRLTNSVCRNLLGGRETSSGVRFFLSKLRGLFDDTEAVRMRGSCIEKEAVVGDILYWGVERPKLTASSSASVPELVTTSSSSVAGISWSRMRSPQLDVSSHQSKSIGAGSSMTTSSWTISISSWELCFGKLPVQ